MWSLESNHCYAHLQEKEQAGQRKYKCTVGGEDFVVKACTEGDNRPDGNRIKGRCPQGTA